ncbi:lipopolysaccharide biosynthesis protein [Egicoccus sp. AB-alg2]|uniref:lipopolysaccharide biosynthesis protein n=1 Tax=Egicoccus sp. AB-alg2 TaxID=3242693 RepID=UPI00359E7B71
MLIIGAGANVAGRFEIASTDQRGLHLALQLNAYLALLLGLACLVLTPPVAFAAQLVAGQSSSLVTALACSVYSFSLVVVRQWRDASLALGATVATLKTGAAALVFAAVVGFSAAATREVPAVLLAASAVFTIEALTLASPLRRLGGGSHSRPGISQMWRVYRAGWRAAPATLGQAAALRLDRLILGVLGTPRQLGVYAAAVAVSEVVWAVSVGLAQYGFSKESLTEPRTLLRRSFAVSAIMAAGVGAAAPIGIPLLFGPAYAPAVPLLWLLLPASVLLGLYHVVSHQMWNRGDFRMPSRISAVGAAGLLVGSITLIPVWGMWGAAAATTASYGLMGLWSFRHFRMHSSAGSGGIPE